MATELIERRIYLIRGRKVMLDSDLAGLYQSETRALVQAVKRNLDRFPDDFMFQLNQDEFDKWRSQIVMSNPAARMGMRRSPYAFTEQGVAMLSSVLNSKRGRPGEHPRHAGFVKLRDVMATHKVAQKIEALERKYQEHDQELLVVFEAIKRLLEPSPLPPKRSVGFRVD